MEWGPYKVRVCGIVPGGIEGTEGFARLGDFGNLNSKEKSNASFEKGKEEKKDGTVFGKLATSVPI